MQVTSHLLVFFKRFFPGFFFFKDPSRNSFRDFSIISLWFFFCYSFRDSCRNSPQDSSRYSWQNPLWADRCRISFVPQHTNNTIAEILQKIKLTEYSVLISVKARKNAESWRNQACKTFVFLFFMIDTFYLYGSDYNESIKVVSVLS